MRGWQLCFLAVPATFLLQVSPFPGMLVFVLGAPFWSVVLVNLGFLLLLGDALRGRVPRAAALAPLLWFGGYAAAAGASHWLAWRHDAAIEEANRGKAVRWDASIQDVVVETGGLTRSDDYAPLNAAGLVMRHGLARAYEARDAEDSVGNVVSLVAAPCPEGAKGGRHDAGAPGYWHVIDEEERPQSPTGSRWAIAADLCEIQAPGRPERPQVTVAAGPRVLTRTWPLQESTRAVTIRTPDGTATTLVAGGAVPRLQWLPMPMIGCGLIDDPSAWHCTAEFLTHTGDIDEARLQLSPTAVAAVALGLPTLTPRQRFPDAGWH